MSLWGRAKGVFRWKDDQQRWVEMNEGLTKLAVQSLTIAKTGDWYVGTAVEHSGVTMRANIGRISAMALERSWSPRDLTIKYEVEEGMQ